jgi:serine/threonine-protein kinase RsbW
MGYYTHMAVAIDSNLALADQTTIAHEYVAAARSVRQARNDVAAFAERHGAAGVVLEDIRMAVSEAATNVVVHAYDEDVSGRFRVLAVVGGGQLLVIVDDDGRGLTAPSQHPGLGLGVRLMQQAAEQVLIRARDFGGSTVQLRFRLGA